MKLRNVHLLRGRTMKRACDERVLLNAKLVQLDSDDEALTYWSDCHYKLNLLSALDEDVLVLPHIVYPSSKHPPACPLSSENQNVSKKKVEAVKNRLQRKGALGSPESNVIADADANLAVGRIEKRQVIARGKCIGLFEKYPARYVNVEEVHLAVLTDYFAFGSSADTAAILEYASIAVTRRICAHVSSHLVLILSIAEVRRPWTGRRKSSSSLMLLTPSSTLPYSSRCEHPSALSSASAFPSTRRHSLVPSMAF
ncbi:hypothetical protein PsorP6_002679 [Peronosclerospora sorghi]|uniref:Uncharacterized protein n=1 Tax=Peronosclerospora sorghi TaxID=230839 RepID=A0ACC0WSK7_9STRA|nr:hypothetical protein PsorP6_002679 [Peronosclerospora sorghi]